MIGPPLLGVRTASWMGTPGEKRAPKVGISPTVFGEVTGDTTPCGMTGVTLHNHVHCTEMSSPESEGCTSPFDLKPVNTHCKGIDRSRTARANSYPWSPFPQKRARPGPGPQPGNPVGVSGGYRWVQDFGIRISTARKGGIGGFRILGSGFGGLVHGTIAEGGEGCTSPFSPKPSSAHCSWSGNPCRGKQVSLSHSMC